MLKFLYLWCMAFYRVITTPAAWRCFCEAVATARRSNMDHCGNPTIGLRGLAAIGWIVSSFWKEDNECWLVEKSTDFNEEGDVISQEWVFVGWQHPFHAGVAEAEFEYTRVDYYTCVYTPVGVIPLPWVDQWFPLTMNKWDQAPSEDYPRYRSSRSQFRVGDKYPTR